MYRYQKDIILQDLEKKMVFLVGPRQVGKTWLSRDLMEKFPHSLYLNYDNRDDQDVLHTQSWREHTDLLVLDELHKMPQWKTFVKGIYDKKLPHQRILVTGSARLDTFRQAGEALSGRFFTHRLLPFSAKELALVGTTPDLKKLFSQGGFPEPYLSHDADDIARWRQSYIDGLIREDIVNFESISQFKTLSMLIKLLQRSVGSPLSYASLARDLQISSVTVKKYIETLEALFIVFSVRPYSTHIARSILKEPKIYFYDTGMVIGDDGVKFENALAISLLKHVWGTVDRTGADLQLHYLRTKEGQEVDFCLARDGQIESIIEAKLQNTTWSKGLCYFCEKYAIKGIQVVAEMQNRAERQQGSMTLRRASEYLLALFL